MVGSNRFVFVQFFDPTPQDNAACSIGFSDYTATITKRRRPNVDVPAGHPAPQDESFMTCISKPLHDVYIIEQAIIMPSYFGGHLLERIMSDMKEIAQAIPVFLTANTDKKRYNLSS